MSARFEMCRTCIMDTSDPEISFDESGQCNHCRKYFQEEPTTVFRGEYGERRLQAIAARIKEEGRGKPYDCVMGVSGGLDSSFVAYHAHRLGLRPLAVHLDNGWNSEVAVRNIERMMNTFGFDLYTEVLDWEEFRDIQMSFLKASVANCEIPTDHAINAIVTRLTAKYGLRYTLSGGNFVTEGILPRAWGYDSLDAHHIKAIHKKFGKVPIRTFPMLSLFDFFYFRLIKRVRSIRVLDYVPYTRESALRILQDEVGYEYYGGKHHESVYTRFFQGYILPRKFGFDKRRAHLSTLVCSGQISREEALQTMNDPVYDQDLLEHDRAFVTDKFGLSAAEFDAIMETPPKSYSEYPNSEALMARLRKLQRMIVR